MPEFAKNPKFIGAVVAILWLAYVIEANLGLTIQIHLLPFLAYLELRVSTALITAAVLGAVAALVIQYLWKRGNSVSKPTSISPAP